MKAHPPHADPWPEADHTTEVAGQARSALRPGVLWPVLLGWLAASALQQQQPELWPVKPYLLCVLAPLALAAWVWRLRRVRRVRCVAADAAALAAPDAGLLRAGRWLGLAAMAGVLAFGLVGLRASQVAGRALSPALEGRDLRLQAVVAGLPQAFAHGQRFRVVVRQAWLDQRPVDVPPRLELSWYRPEREARAPTDAAPDAAPDAATDPGVPADVELRAGDVWEMTVRLKAPHGNVNPQGFDYELWLWEQGVGATGYVRTGRHDAAPQRLACCAGRWVDRARQAVRARILQAVAEPHTGGVIAALVVGDQTAIEREDWDLFRATGVAHLMSISGLHITLFAWLASAAVGALWRRHAGLCARWPAVSAASWVGLALACAYAVFSGWGVPAQRTVWMLAVVTWLRLSGARWPWPAVWLAVCAVVVTVDPWALQQPGFWLSFVAVGVLFASDRGANITSKSGAWDGFRQMFLQQARISLALAPLSLLLFGQVSVVGVLANLLAVPWVTLLVTPLALLGAIWPALWHAAAWALQGLMAFLQTLAAWPGAVLEVAQAPLWAGVAGALGGVVMVLRLPASLRLMGAPLLLPVLLWQTPMPAPGHFEVLALDVGQGSAVLVRTAGHAVLFDAGPRFGADADAGQRVMLPLLRAWGIRLDAVVLSHSDSDHIGGALAVLRQQPRARWLGSLPPDHPVAALRPGEACLAGQRWQWDGVDFEMLHPQPQDVGRLRNTNALSCVLRISNPRHAVLLTGDIPQAQERELLRRYPTERLRSDLMLAPHHGSQTSSSAAFLAAVQPRFVVVQAGYRNRFGHPASSVLVRYAQQGAALVDTPHCGAALWRSSQADSVRCQRQADRRYWHHRVP